MCWCFLRRRRRRRRRRRAPYIGRHRRGSGSETRWDEPNRMQWNELERSD
jgi:hypothetical protein